MINWIIIIITITITIIIIITTTAAATTITTRHGDLQLAPASHIQKYTM